MDNIEEVLLNLVKPLCSDPDSVIVKQMQSIDADTVVLYVYAPSSDLSKLIGKKGTMAQSLRVMMQTLVRPQNKHISIKFEAI